MRVERVRRRFGGLRRSQGRHRIAVRLESGRRRRLFGEVRDVRVLRRRRSLGLLDARRDRLHRVHRDRGLVGRLRVRRGHGFVGRFFRDVFGV